MKVGDQVMMEDGKVVTIEHIYEDVFERPYALIEGRPVPQSKLSPVVHIKVETVNRILFQLGSFASLLETNSAISSTTAAHIDALASLVRDEVIR